MKKIKSLGTKSSEALSFWRHILGGDCTMPNTQGDKRNMRTIADLDLRNADSHYISKNSRYGDLLEKTCPDKAKEIGHTKPYEKAGPIRIPKLKATSKKEENG